MEAKQDLRIALKLAEKAGDQSFKTTVEQYLQEIENDKKQDGLVPKDSRMILIPAGEFKDGK